MKNETETKIETKADFLAERERLINELAAMFNIPTPPKKGGK